MRNSSWSGLVAVISTVSLCVLAGCGDDTNKKKGTTDQQAAEALTLATSFEGGELVDGLVPASNTSSVELLPLDSAAITPGADSLLGFEVAPGDAELLDALVQFGDAEDHFEIVASSFASPDDAGAPGADGGAPARRHFGLVYSIKKNVCDKLCDRKYELQVTEALRIKGKKVTKHKTTTITLDCTDDGDHAQCGAGDDEGAGKRDAQVGGGLDAGVSDTQRDGGTKLTPTDVAAGACDMGSTCKGMDEYIACIQESCDAQYRMCLGDNYKQGDYSGSVCEAFLMCVNESPDPCTNDCVQDAECQSCFSNFSSCATSCVQLLDCGTDASVAFPDGGLPFDTTKTCKDLEACCASLSGSAMDQCTSSLAQFQAAGDIACSAAYSSFCP